MKTTKLLLLLCCFHLAAIAEDTKPLLVVWEKNGSYAAYNLNEKVKIIFTDTELIVRTDEEENSFLLDEMAAFSYETIKDGGASISLTKTLGTYCSSESLDFSQVLGLKAYAATSFDTETGILTMCQVKKAPAGTGLLLVGEADTHNIPYIFYKASFDNLMKGVSEDTEISPTEGDFVNFILANGKQGLGFYRLSATGVLPAGKAYLQLPSAVAGSRMAISIRIDDEVTGIKMVDEDIKDGTFFTLDGLRITIPQKKGVYVKDRKKIIVK